MIPKIIHYCWFGYAEKDEKAQRCIESWRRFLPDYQIVEWNESNFSIKESCNYVIEAYNEKKWAFVSDYARLQILFNNGGVYFDTDVEIIKPFGEILNDDMVLGIENVVNGEIQINPGLVIAAKAGHPLLRKILETYEGEHFSLSNGKNNSKYTIVMRTSKVLFDNTDIKNENALQNLKECTIYPKEYFCPLDYETGKLNITENTKTIHWFSASWLSDNQRRRKNNASKIRSLLPKPIASLAITIYFKFGAAFDILKEKGVVSLLRRLFP